jgi:hypothetical protein
MLVLCEEKSADPKRTSAVVEGRAPKGEPSPTRYKGQITLRQVDRDYPHQVEIAVPEGGLGTLLNAMQTSDAAPTFGRAV